MEDGKKGLAALILAGAPPKGKEDESPEADEKEQGREDLLQAFQDFENKELPMSERMDALSFFVELAKSAGKTSFPDED